MVPLRHRRTGAWLMVSVYDQVKIMICMLVQRIGHSCYTQKPKRQGMRKQAKTHVCAARTHAANGSGKREIHRAHLWLGSEHFLGWSFFSYCGVKLPALLQTIAD